MMSTSTSSSPCSPSQTCTPSSSQWISLLPELIRLIASHLTRSDAIHFAQSHRNFQPSAEPFIWRRLEFTSGWLNGKVDGCKGFSERLVKIESKCRWSYRNNPTPQRTISFHGAAVDRLLRDFKCHLLSRPVRLYSIRHVKLSSQLLTRGMRDVIRPLTEDLVTMDIEPCRRWPWNLLYSEQCQAFFRDPSLTPFIRLRQLCLPLDADWVPTLQAVLSITPNIRRLRLTPIEGFCGGWGELTPFHQPEPDQEWPRLDGLETIVIEEVSTNFLPFLVWLLKTSPPLRRVCLVDTTGELEFDSFRDLLKFATGKDIQVIFCQPGRPRVGWNGLEVVDLD